MPTFLNATTAAIAAGIVVPALLALYFLKLRRQEMSVASTFLWKKTIQDLQVNAPFQKLRRNLLLLLQLLLLALLLFALARPISASKPVAGARTVILIDRSASMNATDGGDGRSRLDEAKRRARDLVGTMSRDARAMVIAFDNTARIVQPFTSDTASLRSAIDSITPSDRPTSLKLAYQLADAQMQFDPDQMRASDNVDLFVYSDGRMNDAEELSTRGLVKFERLGSADSINAGIVALSARRAYDRPTQVQVFVRLANYGPNPVEGDLRLEVAPIDPNDPSRIEFAPTGDLITPRLLPQRYTDEQRRAAIAGGFNPREGVEFRLELTTAAVIRVKLSRIDGDVLASDDVAQIVVPPPKPLRLLLVTAGNAFVERMAQSLGVSEVVKLSPSAYEQQQPADFDVLIFDSYAPQHLPRTGNFIFLGRPPDSLAVKPATDDQGRTEFLENVGVLDWDRDHPILRGLNFGRLYTSQALRLTYPLDAKVLIEGLKGPLAVLHRDARGIVLTLAFDPLDSMWPTQPTFVPFFLQAVQFMALGSDLQSREAVRPGESPLVPRANLERVNPADQQIALRGPSGTQRLTIPPTGDLAFPPLDAVGLYRTDPPIPQFELVAVNLVDETESNTLPAETAPGNVGTVINPDSEQAGLVQTELWWWLVACGAIPMLLIEWWAYTRRVHL